MGITLVDKATQRIIRNKDGLLNLAEELGNVSRDSPWQHPYAERVSFQVLFAADFVALSRIASVPFWRTRDVGHPFNVHQIRQPPPTLDRAWSLTCAYGICHEENKLMT